MPFPLEDFHRGFIKGHFRRKHLVWTEDYFINVLQNPKSSKNDVAMAALALRDCGTLRSLDALKSVLRYPMQDVKCTSILTIAHIARESETPLYSNLLLDPTYSMKGYAMWAILDAADERAVDAVLEYFKRNKSRLRRGELLNGTVSDGFPYLQKFIDHDPRIEQFFREILEFLPNLPYKRWMCTEIAFFREHAPQYTLSAQHD